MNILNTVFPSSKIMKIENLSKWRGKIEIKINDFLRVQEGYKIM